MNHLNIRMKELLDGLHCLLKQISNATDPIEFMLCTVQYSKFFVQVNEFTVHLSLS